MNKKKIIRIALVVVVAGVLVAFTVGYYLFNKPHRNVVEADIDFQISATELVAEYLSESQVADSKYLSDDGKSKILLVTGKVASIATDLNNQIVVTLRGEEQKAGVSCTFTTSTNQQAEQVLVGQIIAVKGVIRSGAGYDEDLDLYEDVIMEKCSINK